MPGKGIDQPFQAKALYDAIRSLPMGMNAGVDPQSVPRGQVSFLRNATVRGNFPTHRPSYRKIALSSLDASIVTAQGVAALGGASLFQHGATYHRAFDGTESLIFPVSGRAFRFAIAGAQAIVSELTTPALRQSPAVPQCWMWQAERFLIFQDGASLPLFFDGTNMRRSNGASNVTIGTVIAPGVTTAQPNASVTIPLAGPYTGPLGVPISVYNGASRVGGVIINSSGASSATGYLLTLKNLKGGTGETVAAGTSLYKPSRYLGFTTADASSSPVSLFNPNDAQQLTVACTADPTPFLGDLVTIHAIDGTIISGSAKIIAVTAGTLTMQWPGGTHASVASGALITSNSNSYTQVGVVAASFVDPAPGSSVSAVQITNALTVPVGTYVILNFPDISVVQMQITGYTVSAGATYNAVGVTQSDMAQGTNLAAGFTLIKAALEMPAGRMGVYGLGRNWISLTDGRRYIGSDIVDGISGTPQYDGEDAILSFTENDFLAGGGSFKIPSSASGQIRGMIFTAQPDTSLGQGPLSIFTDNIVFSCNAPVDRTTWQSLTNPIQTETIIANGGMSHYGIANVNSDTFYRAKDGERSIILGRRQFDTWGNVPASREVDFINGDDPQLLSFNSKIEFDNRMLSTTDPQQSVMGVYHTSIIALNNDGVSSLQGKSPSSYDGVWDAPAGGVLRLIKGEFEGQTRAFAFCLSVDQTQFELWEIMRTDDPFYQDDSGPIVWEMESGALNFYENDPRKRDYLTMTDGELRIDLMGKTYGRNGAAITVAHQILFETFYRGDQDPTWVPWYSFTQTFDPNNNDPGYRSALGLGEPDPKDADLVNDSPQRTSTTFQFKIRITGHCRLLSTRLKGHTEPTPDLAAPAVST